MNANHQYLKECKERRINNLKQRCFYGVYSRNPEKLKIWISKPKSIYEYSYGTVIHLKDIPFSFTLNENIFSTKEEAVEYLKTILKKELNRTAKEFNKYKSIMDNISSSSENIFFDVEKENKGKRYDDQSCKTK